MEKFKVSPMAFDRVVPIDILTCVAASCFDTIVCPMLWINARSGVAPCSTDLSAITCNSRWSRSAS